MVVPKSHRAGRRSAASRPRAPAAAYALEFLAKLVYRAIGLYGAPLNVHLNTGMAMTWLRMASLLAMGNRAREGVSCILAGIVRLGCGGSHPA